MNGAEEDQYLKQVILLKKYDSQVVLLANQAFALIQ